MMFYIIVKNVTLVVILIKYDIQIREYKQFIRTFEAYCQLLFDNFKEIQLKN